MTCFFNFNTPNSQRRIALLLNCLAAQENDAYSLADICDITRQTIQAFMRHLIAEGLVVIATPQKQCGHGSRPAIYRLADGIVVPPLHPDDVSRMPRAEKESSYERTVTVLKAWAAPAIPKQSIFAALGI